MLETIYDAGYVVKGKAYGGKNKARGIRSRFISEEVQIPPGPLLDLLGDLVDVFALPYERPPSEADQEEYQHWLQELARDQSLKTFIAKHPVKLYLDRKERLTATWLLGKFREAVNSPSWSMGPESQRFENPLRRLDPPVRKKRSSAFEFEMDIPRQRKRFKSSVDVPDKTTVPDWEIPEGSDIDGEVVDDEPDVDDEEDTPTENDVDDLVLSASVYEGDTDWEVDEDGGADEGDDVDGDDGADGGDDADGGDGAGSDWSSSSDEEATVLPTMDAEGMGPGPSRSRK